MTSRGRRSMSAVGVGLLGLLAVTTVQAESVFSSVGFGRWNHVADPRAVAMGGTSIASPSRWAFAPRNPAMLGYKRDASVHVSVQTDFTRVREFDTADTRTDARFPVLAVAVPLFSEVVAGVSLFDLNDPRTNITQTISGDPDYELSTKVDGAWTEVAFTVARPIGPGSLGLQLGFPLSSFDQTATRTFSEQGFSNRTERTQTSLEDIVFLALGGHVQVGRASAGAYWQFETTGEVASTLSLGEDAESRTDFSWTMPAAFGAGVALDVSEQLTLTGEWRRQEWDTSLINGFAWRERAETVGIRNAFQNVDAFGAGLEWRRGTPATRSVWKRLSWRAGFGIEPWMVTGPNGGEVTDRNVSLGLGIPFAAGNGELGTALTFTSRRESGDQALREDVVSVLFGLSFAKQPRTY